MAEINGHQIKADDRLLCFSDSSNHDDWDCREDNSAGWIALDSKIVSIGDDHGVLQATTLSGATYKIKHVGHPYFIGVEGLNHRAKQRLWWDKFKLRREIEAEHQSWPYQMKDFLAGSLTPRNIE